MGYKLKNPRRFAVAIVACVSLGLSLRIGVMKFEEAFKNDSANVSIFQKAEAEIVTENKSSLEFGESVKKETEKHIPVIPVETLAPTPTAKSTRGNEDRGEIFWTTAYDLAFEGCGKVESNPSFGITYNGTNVKGKYFPNVRYVAVDVKKIPMNSIISLEFIDPKYAEYNGEYKAVDTGSLVKGNVVDIFMGDNRGKKEMKKTVDFGITKAYVKIIEKGK